jgi:[ribosomal protein S18]-alanine N-acetyltransferase
MIRRAKLVDAAGIEAIELAWSSTAGWKLAQISAELARPESVFLVSENDRRLDGHGAFRRELDEAHILTLAVRPDRVRRGLGRELLESLVLEAERLGLAKMSLEVAATNTSALGLYRSRGFAEVGRRKGFYDPLTDAVLMDLVL